MPGWVVAALLIIGVMILAKLLLSVSILSVHPITRGAMFHPSARIRVKTFLDHVPMEAGIRLVDIGCGDGRVLRAARERYGVQAIGFEVNPLAYFLSLLRTSGLRGIEIHYRNFWKVNLRDADIVFCYLFPDVMARLGEKLKSELRPGTPVVSCNFPLPGWTHVDVFHPDSSLHGDPIYLYRTPGKGRL